MQVVRVDTCVCIVDVLPQYQTFVKLWETIWAVAEHDLVIELRGLLFML